MTTAVVVPDLNRPERSELDTDMISRFPDYVLSHILSFLLTKYAVATSVLSKRWEFLWTQIHSFYFDDKMPSISHRDDQDAGRRMTFLSLLKG
ncbi:hypothetical protein LIER_02021 [Lithospermum erythrorhizon]|uniref:F-box domain-containing protein n=1 Tax=Lithospermum erythrorhizon TaxID=34254 RepID=A0AAV3NP34_LITER